MLERETRGQAYDAFSMEPQMIKQIIEELLRMLSIGYESVEIVENSPTGRTTFNIITDDAQLLAGEQGDALASFNRIARLIAKRRAPDRGRVSFAVDVNNRLGRRAEEIFYRAQVALDRVKLFRRDVEMRPAEAYERMLVHTYCSGIPEITTESKGEGKSRRVVLKYTPEKDGHSRA